VEESELLLQKLREIEEEEMSRRKQKQMDRLTVESEAEK